MVKKIFALSLLMMVIGACSNTEAQLNTEYDKTSDYCVNNGAYCKRPATLRPGCNTYNNAGSLENWMPVKECPVDNTDCDNLCGATR